MFFNPPSHSIDCLCDLTIIDIAKPICEIRRKRYRPDRALGILPSTVVYQAWDETVAVVRTAAETSNSGGARSSADLVFTLEDNRGFQSNYFGFLKV